ncbi:MAG: LamG domain-containing protein [Verrucomicrobia bacterium]|nr:LamG domain-containing protein [Verrucomicrobiota bacterium]
MRKTTAIAIIFGLLQCRGHADLIAHYNFDSVTESGGVFTSDEVTSAGTNFATAGIRSQFIQSCRRLGTGSLLLENRAGSDTAGIVDGALSNNTFNWSASDVRTIAFWMKAAVTQTDAQPTMVSFRSAAGTANGQRFDVRLDAGKLRVELQGGGSTATSAASLNDNNWHHVAVVVPLATSTLANVKYYIDGQLIGNFSGTASINTATSQLRMGDSLHDNNRDFTGSLDDVRVYNEALGDAAVLALYNDGVANLPAVLCFRGSSATIVAGQSANILWEVDPAASSASVDNGIGDVLALGTQGSVSVSPTVTTTYILTVQRGAEQVLQEFTIVVNPALPLAITSAVFNGTGGFVVTVANLIPGRDYEFVRTGDPGDFDHATGTAVLLQPFVAAAETLVLTDPNPPDGKAFYRVQAVQP